MSVARQLRPSECKGQAATRARCQQTARVWQCGISVATHGCWQGSGITVRPRTEAAPPARACRNACRRLHCAADEHRACAQRPAALRGTLRALPSVAVRSRNLETLAMRTHPLSGPPARREALAAQVRGCHGWRRARCGWCRPRRQRRTTGRRVQTGSTTPARGGPCAPALTFPAHALDTCAACGQVRTGQQSGFVRTPCKWSSRCGDQAL